MDWSIGNILLITIGGAIIGMIARLLLRGRQNIPFWAVIIAGIIGMFVGDWLSPLFGVKETFGFDWIRHGLQLLVGVGAVAVLAALSALFGRRRSADRSGSHAGSGVVAAGAAGTAAVAGAAATSLPDSAASATTAVQDAGDGAADAVGDAASQIVPPAVQYQPGGAGSSHSPRKHASCVAGGPRVLGQRCPATASGAGRHATRLRPRALAA